MLTDMALICNVDFPFSPFLFAYDSFSLRILAKRSLETTIINQIFFQVLTNLSFMTYTQLNVFSI